MVASNQRCGDTNDDDNNNLRNYCCGAENSDGDATIIVSVVGVFRLEILDTCNPATFSLCILEMLRFLNLDIVAF